MRYRRSTSQISAGLVVLLLAALAPTALVVPAAQADTIAVTTTVDGGPGSLRAAFDAANASPGDDVIELAPDTVYDLTICGPTNDANATGDLEHRQVTTLTIQGNGSTIRQLCYRAGAIGTERPAGTLRVEDLTIRDAQGGGIRAKGRVELVRSALLDNGDVPGSGPGIGGVVARDVLLLDSTVAGNHGWELGAVTFERSLAVINSTVTDNSPGGITAIPQDADAEVTLMHATVIDNYVARWDGPVPLDLYGHGNRDYRIQLEVGDSVLGICDDYQDVVATESFGFNAESARSCGLLDPTDLHDVADLGLGALADNGGPTPTRLPAPASPLTDAAWYCTPYPGTELDQRGEPRPMGAGCDIGAVEAPGPLPIEVTTTADGGAGSLRAAIDQANTNPGLDVVRLEAENYTLDLCGPEEDGNASGDLDSTDALAILGQGATIGPECGGPAIHAIAGDVRLGNVWLDGGGLLAVNADVRGSTIRNSDGAGIEVSDGAEVTFSRIEDNAGQGVFAPGGCDGDASVDVIQSTVAGNGVGVQAPSARVMWSTVTDNGPGPEGGGIVFYQSGQVIDSTVHGNRSTVSGGGVFRPFCDFDGATLEVVLSTVTGNEAPTGGANIHTIDSALTAIGSVMAEAQGGGTDCSVEVTLSLGSFDGDSSCDLTDVDSISGGGDPHLGPLADNTGGGAPGLAMLTRRPNPDSPVIDAFWGCIGDDFKPEQRPDQNGVVRAQGAWCDMGAVEVEQPPTFKDVPYSFPFFFHEIECVASLGVALGTPDGYFVPERPITREAVAAWLWRLAGSPPPSGESPFSDVTASPFAPAIAWLAEAGITEGYPDGTFHPNQPISREAVSVWLARAAGSPAPTEPLTFPDVNPASQFAPAIAWLAEIDVTEGYDDGTFKPTRDISRQALAAWVCRYEHEDVMLDL